MLQKDPHFRFLGYLELVQNQVKPKGCRLDFFSVL